MDDDRLDVDGGRHFALHLTVGADGPRTARVFLFDLDGALLDRVDVGTNDPRAIILAGFAPSFTDLGAFLIVSATYMDTSLALQIPLIVSRDCRQDGRPAEPMGTIPKGTLYLGVRDGRFEVR